MAQRLVCIERSLKHAEDLPGFVVAVGDRWAVIQNVIDGGYFDGYSAFRVKDVVRVKRRKSFERAFAQQLPTWPPRAPADLVLDTARSVVSSMASNSSLVAIEQERRRSAQWIGVLVASEAKFTWLHEISPKALWHEEPLGYRNKEITLVSIETHYQRALAAMASERP